MRQVCSLVLLLFTLIPQPGRASSPDDALIIYEIFVRNFSEEGTIAGVESRLDEIADLGVNVIWLMPIYPIGEQSRKGEYGSPYAVRDFMAVHPELGTTQDLKRLVQATHRRGMKLILDIVPNHCAPDNPWVAEHPDWIKRDKRGRPAPPVPAWSDVVGLDYQSPGLREKMREVMRYWITEFDIDGYRVDVAGMIPEDFWRETIPVLRALKPGLIMLAEAEGPLYHQLGFDFSYDDSLRILMAMVSRNQEPVSRLNDYITSVISRYPPGAQLMRFTENHDHHRTLHHFRPPLDRVAAAAIFTLPGLPMLFAGQEAGIPDTPKLFEHDPVPWKQGDLSTRTFYKELIQLRKTHPALARGDWRPLETNQKNIMAYQRTHERDELIVLLDFGRQTNPVSISGIHQMDNIERIEDAYTGQVIPASITSSNLTITSPIRPDAVITIIRNNRDTN